MTRYKISLVVESLSEGGYLVTSPDVPGLLTDGDAIEEALANVPDAVQTLIEAMRFKGVPLPPALRPIDDRTPVDLETIVSLPVAA